MTNGFSSVVSWMSAKSPTHSFTKRRVVAERPQNGVGEECELPPRRIFEVAETAVLRERGGLLTRSEL